MTTTELLQQMRASLSGNLSNATQNVGLRSQRINNATQNFQSGMRDMGDAFGKIADRKLTRDENQIQRDWDAGQKQLDREQQEKMQKMVNDSYQDLERLKTDYGYDFTYESPWGPVEIKNEKDYQLLRDKMDAYYANEREAAATKRAVTLANLSGGKDGADNRGIIEAYTKARDDRQRVYSENNAEFTSLANLSNEEKQAAKAYILKAIGTQIPDLTEEEIGNIEALLELDFPETAEEMSLDVTPQEDEPGKFGQFIGNVADKLGSALSRGANAIGEQQINDAQTQADRLNNRWGNYDEAVSTYYNPTEEEAGNTQATKSVLEDLYSAGGYPTSKEVKDRLLESGQKRIYDMLRDFEGKSDGRIGGAGKLDKPYTDDEMQRLFQWLKDNYQGE